MPNPTCTSSLFDFDCMSSVNSTVRTLRLRHRSSFGWDCAFYHYYIAPAPAFHHHLLFFIICLSCPAFLYWYFSKLSFFLALATGDWRSTGLGGHRTCASITKTGKIGNKIARYSIFFFLETGVEGFTSHGLLILFHCRYWWGYICSLLPFADLPLFYTCF